MVPKVFGTIGSVPYHPMIYLLIRKSERFLEKVFSVQNMHISCYFLFQQQAR